MPFSGTPPPPTGLAASPGNNLVALSWSVSVGANSYNVYLGTSSGGESSSPIATGITGTGYVATGLSDGTAYYFKVAAVNSGGTSGYSNEASAAPTSALPNGYSYFATYDPVGNVASYNDSVMGSWTFGYDPLNRLVTAQNTAVTGASAQFLDDYGCWKYDNFGNREYESMSTTACTSNPPLISWASFTTTNTNRMDSTSINSNQATNGYDVAGNVIYDGNNKYLYDPEGRVCAAWNITSGSATGYIYDAEGVRVAKGNITNWGSCDPAVNGAANHLTNIYALGPNNEQFTETNGSGNWQHTNVWGGGKPLATYDSVGLHFYIDDPLGSRRVEANYAGVTQEDCLSGPYGDFESCLPTPTEHLFTGKERDAESGNDYFEARYLGSSMGRFLSPDPVGGSLANPQTLNKYAYVLNNPLTNTDPTGLYACKDGKDGACTSDQDKAYEASRQHDLQSKNADVRRGAAAMGDPGKEVVNARGDKVTVGFADLGKSGEGGVTHSELGSNDKGDPISVSNVTINSNSRGTALDADVGHEGSHVADAQDMAGSITYTSTSFHVGQDISQYASEQRAYRVTDAIYRSANESYNGCGNANCALGAGSSPVGIPGRVDAILLANPNIYHGLNGKPMTSTNQGGNVLGVVVPH
jgi:RHS repeat-associated protein